MPCWSYIKLCNQAFDHRQGVIIFQLYNASMAEKKVKFRVFPLQAGKGGRKCGSKGWAPRCMKKNPGFSWEVRLMNTEPGRIVVLISADIEWRALRGLLPEVEIQASPYGEWFTTTLQPEMPLLFFHGGWGKIAAAGSTQYVIDRWRPDLLVNLGTCGGFAGEVERGEILLVERTLVYDIIEQMGDFDEHIAHYTTEIDLSWLREPFPQVVRRSLLVSGDRDLLVEDVPMLKERYRAVAGDWESGAIAFIAARNNLRLLILRGVSDLVSPAGSEAYGNLQYYAEATGAIFSRMLAALPLWVAQALQ
jgi:adenosylhomocysteine nucleosidase